jgi:hypothetical protein
MANQGFYLAGGTASALQLGHRRSVDFDWFSEARIPDPLRLARELEETAPVRVTATEKGTLHATLFGVRLSVIEYRYPLLGPVVTSSVVDLRLASLPDIASMKLAAVAQRGSRKDFVDVFALGQKMSLDRMLRSYRTKYGVRDTGHLLYALSYFDDAERERMPRMLRPWDWATIKRTIQRWVREIAG